MKSTWKKILIAVLIFIFCSSLFACGNNISPKTNDSSKLYVHFIDVGQGDSILIQHNNKNMLIDAGPKGCNITNYLKNNNVKKIDVVVATHPHEDHIGEMASVIDKFNIGEFYAPKITTSTNSFSKMITALKNKNLKINVASSGKDINLWDDIDIEMFAPINSKYEDMNNYSAVIKLTYKKTSFLFTGDAQKISEQEMLQKDFNFKSDVLKVGHHGSSSSTTDAFLNKVSPKFAVISCGKNNDYGHPHKSTLTRLEKHEVKYFRTDIDGTIDFISDGDTVLRK